MLILRIDDVGRVDGDAPEEGSDRDLTHFKRWREEAGLVGLPAVYGVVPAWLGGLGIDYLRTFSTVESIAVHGLSHKRGEWPTPYELISARDKLLGAVCYIPPFNEYARYTIHNWGRAGGKYFLGGFPGEHHTYGANPVQEAGVTHLSADPILYGRARDFIPSYIVAREMSNPEQVRVITLHAPWENHPGKLREFVTSIGPYLTDIHAVLLPSALEDIPRG